MLLQVRGRVADAVDAEQVVLERFQFVEREGTLGTEEIALVTVVLHVLLELKQKKTTKTDNFIIFFTFHISTSLQTFCMKLKPFPHNLHLNAFSVRWILRCFTMIDFVDAKKNEQD